MKYFANFRHSVGVLVRHRGWSWQLPIHVWRSLAWYFQVAVGSEPRARVSSWRAKFVLPCLWRTPAKLFYVFRRHYEPEVQALEELLQGGDWVIDVGANFGLYTVLAGRKVEPEGRVLAFEPFPDSFQMLRRNSEGNALQDVAQLWPCALGERTGTATLSVHADPGRNTLGSLGSEGGSEIQISVRPFDEIAEELAMSRIDFIKMDVEGFELQVLRGARRSIEKFKPSVLFELNPMVCRQSGYDPADIVKFFQDAGYVLFECQAPGEWQEVAPEEFGNYLAVHGSRLKDGRFRGQRLRRR